MSYWKRTLSGTRNSTDTRAAESTKRRRRRRRPAVAAEPLERRDLLAIDFPTATLQGPEGSLLYGSRASASIDTAGEVEMGEIEIAGGQTVYFQVDPVGNETLQPSVEIVRDGIPVRQDLRLLVADSPGDSAVVAFYTRQATKFQLLVTGENGTTGQFNVSAMLNGRAELEEASGQHNDSITSAESLDLFLTGHSSVAVGTVAGSIETIVPVEPFATDFENDNWRDGWTLDAASPAGIDVVDRADGEGRALRMLTDDDAPRNDRVAPEGFVYLYYDAASGEISVDTSAPLSLIEIKSESGIFDGDPAAGLGDTFDVDRDDKIFKLATDGFDDLSFGNVARAGLSADFIARDLSATAAWGEGGLAEIRILQVGSENNLTYTLPKDTVPDRISFQYAMRGGEVHPLPDSFAGGVSGDGIALSYDGGKTWQTVFTPAVSDGSWVDVTVPIGIPTAASSGAARRPIQLRLQQFSPNGAGESSVWFDDLRIEPVEATGDDWFRIEIQPGERLSLAATTLLGDGDTQFELYDSAGTHVGSSVLSDSNAATINNLQNTGTESLLVYARVSADVGTSYSLSGATNAEFDFALLGRGIFDEGVGVIGYLDSAEFQQYPLAEANEVEIAAVARDTGEFGNRLAPQAVRSPANVAQVTLRGSGAGEYVAWPTQLATDQVAEIEVENSQDLASLLLHFDRSISITETPQIIFGGTAVAPEMISVVDGNTIELALSAELADGLYGLQVEATSPTGVPFSNDANQLVNLRRSGPRVVNSSIKNNTAVAVEDVAIEIEFDAEIDPSVLTVDDVALVGVASGPVVPDALLVDGSAVTIVVDSLPVDEFTLTLRSAVDGFRGSLTGLMDGDGDGVDGGDFVLNFENLPTIIEAPFTRINGDIAASVARAEGLIRSELAANGIPLDFENAGQRLGIEITSESGFTPRLELRIPGGDTVATWDGQAGGAATFDLTLAQAGPFILEITSADGSTGRFDIELRHNVSDRLPAANDRFDSALPIDEHFAGVAFDAELATVLTRPDNLEPISGGDESFEAGQLPGNWNVPRTSANAALGPRVTNAFGAGEGEYALVLDGELTEGLLLQDDTNAIVYDPVTGNLTLWAPEPIVSTIEIVSDSRQFRTEVDLSWVVRPPFDVFTENKLFLLKTDGIGTTDFGPILPAGLSLSAVQNDLRIRGSVLPSGRLDAQIVVPGPGPEVARAVAFFQIADVGNDVILEFDHVNWQVEDAVNGASGDGVSIRLDGGQWHSVFTPGSSELGQWDTYQIDLTRLVAAQPQPATLQVAFQSTTDQPAPNGGAAYDNIRILANQPPAASFAVDVLQIDFESGELPASALAESSFGSGVTIGEAVPGSDKGMSLLMSADPDATSGDSLSADLGLVYDTRTGNVSFAANSGVEITTLEIDSASGLFLDAALPDTIRPPFDVLLPHRLLISRNAGVSGTVDLGPILPQGLSVEFLREDLTLSASRLPDGEVSTEVLEWPISRSLADNNVVVPVALPLGASEASLTFSTVSWGDPTIPPSQRPGRIRPTGDGVWVSFDAGSTWSPFFDIPEQPAGEWQEHVVNFDVESLQRRDFLLAFSASNFGELTDGGRAIDDIRLTANVHENSLWYSFELEDGEQAMGFVHGSDLGDHFDFRGIELYDASQTLLTSTRSNIFPNLVDVTEDGAPDRYFVRVLDPTTEHVALFMTKNMALYEDIRTSQNHLYMPSFDDAVSFVAPQDGSVDIGWEVISASLPTVPTVRFNGQVIEPGATQNVVGLVPGTRASVEFNRGPANSEPVSGVLRVAGAELETDLEIRSFPSGQQRQVPRYVTIQLSDPIRQDLVRAEGFRVDGVPASDLVIEGANRILIPMQDRSQRQVVITIDAGSITGVNGLRNLDFQADFDVPNAPRIVGASVADGDEVGANSELRLEFEFDQPLAIAGVLLWGPTNGPRNETRLIYNETSMKASAVIDVSVEGEYTALIAGARGVTGLVLDGEIGDAFPTGDGVSGGAFEFSFGVDDFAPSTTDFAWSAPSDVALGKSQVVSRYVTVGDVDTIGVSVGAGQQLQLRGEVMGEPSDTSVVSLRLTDPDGDVVFETPLLVGAFATTPVLTDAAGEHTIELVSLDAAAGVRLQAALNVTREHEGRQESSNQDIASAESLVFSAPAPFGSQFSSVEGSLLDTPATPIRREQETFASGLGESWRVQSTSGGSVEVVQDAPEANGPALAMVGAAGIIDRAMLGEAAGEGVIVYYDPDTGEVSVDTGIPLRFVLLQSASGIFTGSEPLGLDSPLDSADEFAIAKIGDAEFVGDFSLGAVAQPGLDPAMVVADLTVQAVAPGADELVPTTVVPLRQAVINEAVWEIDLRPEDVLSATLYLDAEAQTYDLPAAYTGLVPGDGVSISQDGSTWYRVPWEPTKGEWTTVDLPLAETATQHGFDFFQPVLIKLQQTSDNATMYWRELSVGQLQDSDWYRLELEPGAEVSLRAEATHGRNVPELNVFLQDNVQVTSGIKRDDGLSTTVERLTNTGAQATEFFVRVSGDGADYRLSAAKQAALGLTLNSIEAGVPFSLPMSTQTGDVVEQEPNDTLATAMNLDGLFALELDPDVPRSSTLPHVSIRDSGDGSVDTYAIRVDEANRTLRVGLQGHTVDMTISVYRDDVRLRSRQLTVGQSTDVTFNLGQPGEYQIQLEARGQGELSLGGPYTAHFLLNEVTGRRNEFVVPANSGDLLTIGGQPIRNTTQVHDDGTVLLYDPEGQLVASTTSRDEPFSLQYQVTVGGDYSLQLRGDDDNRLDIIRVSGSTATQTSYQVIDASIESGALLTETVGDVVLQLPRAFNVSSVETAGVLFNGDPVAWRVGPTPDSLHIGLPAIEDQLHTISLLAGAVTDLQGNEVEAFDLNFTIDRAGPTVLSTTLERGQVFSTDSFRAEFVMSEAIDVDTLTRQAIRVRTQGASLVAPASLTFDPNTNTIAADFNGVPDGEFSLTVSTSFLGMRDLAGNEFDYLPETSRLDALTIPLQVELGPLSYDGGFMPVDPTYATRATKTDWVSTELAGGLDVDTIVYDLQEGQAFSVELSAARSLSYQASVYKPDGTMASSFAVSEAHVVSPVIVADMAGEYRLEFSSSDRNVGRIASRLLLNHGEEAIVAAGQGDVQNNSVDSAFDLDLLPNGDGQTTFVAIAPEPSSDEWFSFTLEDGQVFSLGLKGVAPTHNSPTVQVYGPDMQPVALVPSAHGDWVTINGLRDRTSNGTPDRYWVQAAASDVEPLTLSLLRDAQFADPAAAALPQRIYDGVAIQGRLLDQATTRYALVASAGDRLRVELDSPWRAPGSPDETLEVAMQIIAPDGSPVDSVAGAGALQLEFDAAVDGSYVVEINNTSVASDYRLIAVGSTATVAPRVIGIDPTDGDTVLATRRLEVVFDSVIDYASIDPQLVTMNGVAAALALPIDHRTVEFRFTQHSPADQEVVVVVAAGAVSDIDGQASIAFESRFNSTRLAGDFDENGTVESGDVAAFCRQLRAGEHARLDRNEDGVADVIDLRTMLVEDLFSQLGDVNFDGVFDSSDLVKMLADGKYEADVEASYEEGDLNCDGRFTTADLILAMGSL